MNNKDDTNKKVDERLENGSLPLEHNIDLWKYFESTGGSDKDRMVAVVTWLLAFATAILAYIATNDIDLALLRVKSPREAIVFAALGLFICALSGYLVHAFGTHAERNWARASTYRLRIPGLDQVFSEDSKKKSVVLEWFFRGKFALIFRMFFIFVAFLFLCFVAIIIWSSRWLSVDG